MSKVSEIEKQLTSIHGDLHTKIPKLVNRCGQERAARLLSKKGLVIKQAWVSRWLRLNGYTRRIVWERSNVSQGVQS